MPASRGRLFAYARRADDDARHDLRDFADPPDERTANGEPQVTALKCRTERLVADLGEVGYGDERAPKRFVGVKTIDDRVQTCTRRFAHVCRRFASHVCRHLAGLLRCTGRTYLRRAPRQAPNS